ncbi:MAG: hypothetical protein KY475_08335 [Planctomycetes bacterium]|nr:hypothetical protein [Planctomycetota bacterium]
MDRLELALRRYRQICAAPAGPGEVPMRDVVIWLREDVSRVLEEYAFRPTFRAYASWPVVALCPGAETPERHLVERAGEQLVECAEALLKVLRLRTVLRKIGELFPPTSTVVSQTVEIRNGGQRPFAAERAIVDHFQIELGQLQAVADRDWTDLVNVADYFEPQQEFVETEDGEWLQRGEWVVSVNPELLPAGNFIVRCLRKRISMRHEILKACRGRCLVALRQIRRKLKGCDAVEEAWTSLTQTVDEIERTFQTGREARLRDACVVSTQLYGAFHPDPDLSWLGLDPEIVENGLAMVKFRLRTFQGAHMLERAAASLGDLRRLYEEGRPDQSEIEESIASGGLVILESDHIAYWEGKQLTKEIVGTSWKFLHALARKARHRAAVEERDVFDKVVSDSAMSTAWGRLKKMLPAPLWSRVKLGAAPRTYRLDLEPHRIFLFS